MSGVEPGYGSVVGSVLFWSGLVVCLCWIAAELGDAARAFLDQARRGGPEEAGDDEAAWEGRGGAPRGDAHEIGRAGGPPSSSS